MAARQTNARSWSTLLPFSVGRQPGCCLQLNYRTISGHHADLQLDRNQLWVVDRKSTNGTYVNGRRITEPTPLREEDLLQFADVAMRVKCDVRRRPATPYKKTYAIKPWRSCNLIA